MNLMEKLGLNRVVRFRMYFDGKGAATAAVMMGIAFFLRVVYYFGFPNLDGCGAGELIINLILPLLLCGSFAVLLKGFRARMVQVYGILSAIYCVLMMVWTFDSQHIFHFILSVIWYLAAIVIVAGTVQGYISNRLMIQLAFVIPVIFRFFFYDLGEYVQTLRIVDFLPEASALCGLIALSGFAQCLIPERLRQRASEKSE